MKRSTKTAQARPHLKGQRGNALVLSVMFLAVITVTSLAILDLAVVYNNQLTLASNWVRERIILESIADYFTLAMKQRWCVDSFLNSSPSGSGACQFTNDNNMERLMTDDEFIGALAEAGVSYGIALPTLIRIPQMDYDVAVSSISASNPLKALFDQPGMQVFDRIVVNLRRMDNKSEGTSAQESYVAIRVTLRASTNLTVFRNTAQIWLERRMGIFRRDLSYFSLIVPRNLYLDGSAASTPGDFSFLRGVGGAGLRFESPIFVNQDIHLASTGANNTAVFSDTIFQGNGIVMKAGSPFAPATTGASTDRYWNQILQADGIMAGISVDGRRDQGLDVLVGNMAATPINSTAAKDCINLTRSMADLAVTRDSQFVVRQLPAPAPAGPNQHVLLFDLGFTRTRFPGMNQPAGVALAPVPANNPDQQWLINFAKPDEIWPNLINLQHQRAGWWAPNMAIVPTDPARMPAVNFRWLKDPETHDTFQRPAVQVAITAQGPTGRAYFFGMMGVGSQVRFFPVGGQPTEQFQVTLETNYPNFQALQPPLLSTVQLRVTSFSSNVRRPDMWTSLDIQVQGLDHGNFASEDRRVPGFMMYGGPGAPGAVVPPANPIPLPTLTLPTDYTIPATAFAFAPGRDDNETRVPGRTPLARISISRAPADIPIVSTIPAAWSIQDSTIRPTTPAPGYPSSPPPYNGAGVPTGIAGIPAGLEPIGVGEPGYIDYADRFKQCAVTSTVKASSFAIGSPDYSYLPNTRSSWNYANHDPNIDGVNPPGYGGLPASSNFTITAANQDQFHNKALMNTCTIDGSATHAVGFFVCDNFVIAGGRAAPLTIVGSIITGRLTIDPTAYARGVTFRSIYHPQSIVDLRSWGNPPILSMVREPREACTLYPPHPANGGDWPIWHPLLSVRDVGDHNNCNSIFFQRKTDNFRWTQVDPDCGFEPTDPANHRCKRRPYKFLIKLIGDQYLLK